MDSTPIVSINKIINTVVLMLMVRVNEALHNIVHLSLVINIKYTASIGKALLGTLCEYQWIFTGRNEVLAKVIFLHLSVIHSVHRGGGVLPAWGGSPCHPPSMENSPSENPPGAENPPWSRHPPMKTPLDEEPPLDGEPPQMENHPPYGEPPPPPMENHHPPPGSRLRHTVYDRPVRILLECILV